MLVNVCLKSVRVISCCNVSENFPLLVPSFFLRLSTPQTVLLSPCTHSFVSNCSYNCRRKCITAHHKLMVHPVRIRRRPGADNCSVLFRISVDICEQAANSLKRVNNVKYPFQTPDKWYMYPCANIKAYGKRYLAPIVLFSRLNKN